LPWIVSLCGSSSKKPNNGLNALKLKRWWQTVRLWVLHQT
jgi:hypothetical protein